MCFLRCSNGRDAKKFAQRIQIFIEFKGPDFICFYGRGGVEEITSAFSFPCLNPFFVNQFPALPSSAPPRMCVNKLQVISKVIIVNYKMCKILPNIRLGLCPGSSDRWRDFSEFGVVQVICTLFLLKLRKSISVYCLTGLCLWLFDCLKLSHW